MRKLIELPVSLSARMDADKFTDEKRNIFAPLPQNDFEDAQLFKLLHSKKPFNYKDLPYTDGEHLRKCIRREVFQQLRDLGATQSQARDRCFRIMVHFMQQLEKAAARVNNVTRNTEGRPSAKADAKAVPHTRSKTGLASARIIEQVKKDNDFNRLYKPIEKTSSNPETCNSAERKRRVQMRLERVRRVVDKGLDMSVNSHIYRQTRLTIEEKDLARLHATYVPTYEDNKNGKLRIA